MRSIEELRRPVCGDDLLEDREEASLNNALLSADNPTEDTNRPAKRNSKESLIDRIITVSEKYDLEVRYSDTKLKRMNKKQLTKVLAEVIEETVKIDMCKQVGVEPGANGRTLGLAALRMMHDIAATGFEKAAQTFLPEYGYEIDGFGDSLKEPTTSQAIDMCLTEIAAESPEILQYFDSPYTRLALVWSGALITCIKRKSVQVNRNYAKHMGPRKNPRPNPTGVGSGRSKTVREIDSNFPSRVSNVRQV